VLNLPANLAKRRWRPLPRTAPDERVYAIGDIHGCLSLMMKMLDLIGQDYARSRPGRRMRIIILGDFIDRGRAAGELLEQLREAEQRTSQVEVLLGNHEAALLDSIAGNVEAQRAWLAFGGAGTLASYGLHPPDEAELGIEYGRWLQEVIGADTIDWLEERPLSCRSGDFFFCHAGIRPGVHLSRQSREDLLWIREPFLSSKRYHGAVIVHGHTIVPGIDIRTNRIAVDTGAHKSGMLSAICLDGSEARQLLAFELKR
jgi:serine/threonine protein phosphatase 1